MEQLIDFDKAIDDHLTREDDYHGERKSGEFHASEMGYCARQLFYKMTSKRIKPDGRSLRIFERGNVIHEWFSNLIKEQKVGRLIKEEVSMCIPDFEEGISIRGRIDNVIYPHNKDEKLQIIEVKTTGSLRRVTRAQSHHVRQIIPYLLYGDCVGGILYIEASTFQTRMFRVNYDPDIMQEIMERAKLVHNSVKENLPPPAEALTNHDMKWQCKYCDFVTECESVERNS